ncbi:MAG: hypothetical protein ACOC9P_01660 [bacterium]
MTKDRAALLTFYDYHAEHRLHLRMTNPIESTFVTARLRTAKTKGSVSRIACITIGVHAGAVSPEAMARAE